MKNETKLTPADLALYLGAECEVTYSPGGFEYYDNGGIYLISGGLINEYGKGEAAIKPILRPLSDMTEDEARNVYKITTGEDYPANDAKSEVFAVQDEEFLSAQMEIGAMMGQPAVWRYLLSRHFDLFGWIEAGLAIDKTKSETK